MGTDGPGDTDSPDAFISADGPVSPDGSVKASVEGRVQSALSQGIAQCRSCRYLTRHPDQPCARCGANVKFRSWRSLDTVWAFWLAGLIAYIPANLYPLMSTVSITGENATTIMESVIALYHHGSYLVAGVVFVFSVCVPVTKLVIIAWLALSLRFNQVQNNHQRHRAHQFIEFIGRWSMIDVFVVAALAALVQVGALVKMVPGMGVNAFALSVIMTMFSASAFDPRLFWDRDAEREDYEQSESRD